ncbi:MAG: hypothetical protein ACREA4_05075, partial [Nitrososphaera sp.]
EHNGAVPKDGLRPARLTLEGLPPASGAVPIGRLRVDRAARRVAGTTTALQATASSSGLQHTTRRFVAEVHALKYRRKLAEMEKDPLILRIVSVCVANSDLKPEPESPRQDATTHRCGPMGCYAGMAVQVNVG